MRAVFVALISVVASPALALPFDRVPDPRPQSAIVDLTGTLDVRAQKVIDEAAARGREGGELVVAVIDRLDGEPPRAYATRLFNRLALDTRERNRGVLLLVALGDRKAEIVVGDGFAETVTSATDRIMGETIVPRFRAQDPAGAIVVGAQALVDEVLLGAQMAAARFPAEAAGAAEPAEPQTDRAVVPAVGSERPARRTRFNPAIGLAGTGALGLAGFVGLRRVLRFRTRRCARCAQPMTRLDEGSDDVHLDQGERTEERLGSVDYDLWSCECGEVLKLRYGAIFTRYAACPACGYKTQSEISRTIRSATQYSTGLAEVLERCEHCGRRHTYTRIIPQKPKPTSSSSGYRSSSSSSSSRGGGSSSGRGSSGSW